MVVRTFVKLDQYNALYKDNIQLNTRFGPETTDPKFGAGRWIRGDFNTFLDGHELIHDYEDDAVHMTVEQEGDAQNKFSALSKHQTKLREDTDKNLAKLSVENMISMVQMVVGQPSTNSSNSQDASVPTAAIQPDAADDESSSSPDEHENFKPTSLFQRLRPPPRTTSASTAAKVTPSPAKAPAGKATPPGAQAPSLAAKGVVTLVDDGRTRRLVKSIQEELEPLSDSVAKICNLSHLVDDQNLFGGAAFTDGLKKVSKQASEIQNKLRTLSRRAKSSSFPSALVTEISDIDTAVERLEYVKTLLAAISKSDRDLDVKVYGCDQHSITVSKPICAAAWLSRVNRLVLHAKVGEAWSNLKLDSDPANALRSAGADKATIINVAVGTATKVFSDALAKVKIQALVHPPKRKNGQMVGVEPVETIRDFIDHFIHIADEEGDNFGPSGLMTDIENMQQLIKPALHNKNEIELQRLEAVVDRMEERHCQLTTDPEFRKTLTPLDLLLLEHEVGKAFVHLGRAVLKENQGELQRDRAISDLKWLQSEICEALMTHGIDDGDDALEDLRERLVACKSSVPLKFKKDLEFQVKVFDNALWSAACNACRKILDRRYVEAKGDLDACDMTHNAIRKNKRN